MDETKKNLQDKQEREKQDVHCRRCHIHLTNAHCCTAPVAFAVYVILHGHAACAVVAKSGSAGWEV